MSSIQKKIFLLILCICISLRFYNTPARYALDFDGSRDALVTISGAQNMQLPLTGPFSSLGPFTFGPWYYIELILFSRIVPVPYAPWIFAGIVSCLFVVSMFLVGKKLIHTNFGLLLASIITISPYSIGTALSISNPNFVSLFTALSLYSIIKILEKKSASLKWGFILGITLGIGINHHYQMLGLLIAPILLLAYDPSKYKHMLLCGVGITITFLPLLIFDLNNHWYTLRNMYYYYTAGKNALYFPNRWLTYLFEFWPEAWKQIFGLPKNIGIIAMAITCISTPIIVWKKMQNAPLLLFFVACATNFVLLRYYWGERTVGYIQFLIPFIYIFVTLVLYKIYSSTKGKYIAILCTIILCSSMATSAFQKFNKGPFETEINREVHFIIQNTKDTQITLYNCKDIYLNRIYALTTLLSYENKISDTGKKYGLFYPGCSYPAHLLTDLDPENKSLASEIYPLTGDMLIDLSAASESAIRKEGWNPITPKVLYTSVARWWFTEQP